MKLIQDIYCDYKSKHKIEFMKPMFDFVFEKYGNFDKKNRQMNLKITVLVKRAIV